MLAIVTHCDQPGCAGEVKFALPDPDDWEGRLRGTCDRCATSYTLYGGERRPVVPLSRHGRALKESGARSGV